LSFYRKLIGPARECGKLSFYRKKFNVDEFLQEVLNWKIRLDFWMTIGVEFQKVLTMQVVWNYGADVNVVSFNDSKIPPKIFLIQSSIPNSIFNS
jgi:hypothetical protein